MDYLKKGGRVILCGWHQQFFGAIRHFKNYRDFEPALMISKSADGEVIAGVSEKSGWCAVRGSSSRGGKVALRKMIEHLSRTGLAGHIVDGPKGPAGIVKAGIIHLAKASNAAIVPFYVYADKAWYFKSWDSFFIPKPFARVTLSFGNLIGPSCSEGLEDLEGQRVALEMIMLPQIRVNPNLNSAAPKA